jgi:hypothetical protein
MTVSHGRENGAWERRKGEEAWLRVALLSAFSAFVSLEEIARAL